jgi:hypothetical protein
LHGTGDEERFKITGRYLEPRSLQAVAKVDPAELPGANPPNDALHLAAELLGNLPG